MGRLIDMDELLSYKFKNPISYNAFVNLVKRQPTIDAVAVVRCKDCKYSEPYDWSTNVNPHLKCLYRSGVWGNWFCEHGEKVTE